MNGTQSAVAAPRRLLAASRFGRRFAGTRLNPALLLSLLLIGLVMVSAALPWLIAPYDPNELRIDKLLAPPSLEHLMGTDEFGRDILSRIIYGSQVALLISVAGVGLGVAFGVPLGLVSGYLSGLLDAVAMRIQDAILAFPAILFAILVVASMGASAFSIILTVGVIYTPRFARLVRGSVLVLKEQDFVLASRACGASDARLILRHILPNCLAPILVQITLAMAVAVLIEAGLSYLGLGVQPPTATWGTMLQHAQSYPAQAPWYVLAPGFCIFVLVLALNMVGDSLRDTLDPRLRGL